MKDASLISDYVLLGDSHGSALVSREGSVDWWCAPRIDAPSLFARLLDPAAGGWSIRPVDEFGVEREYVRGTMVPRTLFSTRGGRLRLTDALALGPGEREHQIGKRSPSRAWRSRRAGSDRGDLAGPNQEAPLRGFTRQPP